MKPLKTNNDSLINNFCRIFIPYRGGKNKKKKKKKT